MKAYQDGRDARVGIGEYVRFYNTQRPHQALGYQTPAEVFMSNPVDAIHGDLIESLRPDPLTIGFRGIVGPALKRASTLSN